MIDVNFTTANFHDRTVVVDRKSNICFSVSTDYYNKCQIKDIEDIVNKIKGKLPKNDALSKKINSAYLFLTDRCNLRCTFCSTRSDNSNVEKHSMSFEEVNADIIPKLVKDFPRKVIISGGEPFVNKDILKILKKLRDSLDSKIIVQTNGTLITEGIISQIEKSVDCFEISTAHYHNLLYLEKTVSLLKQHNFNVALTYVFENDFEKLYRVIDIAAKYDSDFQLHFVDLGGSALDNKCKILDSEQRLEIYYYFFKYILDKNYCNKTFADNFFAPAQASKPCGAFGRMFAIFPDGNIYLCHSLVEKRFRIGSSSDNFILADEIRNVITREDIIELFRNDKYDICRHCNFSLVCSGVCPGFAEKGIAPDCGLKKIILVFNLFFFRANISMKENLINFLYFCKYKEYVKYIDKQ